MPDCPSHTHHKEIKCTSYNGRHEFMTDNLLVMRTKWGIYHYINLPTNGRELHLSVYCNNGCGARATVIYEFKELIEE